MAKKRKTRTVYYCQHCGYESIQYLGRCTECQSWDSFEQITLSDDDEPSDTRRVVTETAFYEPVALCDVDEGQSTMRYSTGMPELDRVLGGGCLPGAYCLLGGDPGVGKSTLMLQMAQHVADAGQSVLIVAGEESPQQIRLRANRLGLSGQGIDVVAETQVDKLEALIKKRPVQLLIVDSIQSLYIPQMSGTPGSVNQIKSSASVLMQLAKAMGITTVLIGHVTKDGGLSGPKLLEHMVDTVLYLEGEKYQNLRVVRAIKNRFGSVNEVGLFEMQAKGMVEVSNPSGLFMQESRFQAVPGSVVGVALEGRRPILVEIQALVGGTAYAAPRRVANGIELSRLHQMVAVLEKRVGLDFSRLDIYVNVVGGLRIHEPAIDLPLAMALVSSARSIPCQPGLVVAGEVGLTGECRPLRQRSVRIKEAAKFGFERMLVPHGLPQDEGDDQGPTSGLSVVNIASLTDALVNGLSSQRPAQPAFAPELSVSGLDPVAAVPDNEGQ
ncbi:MAG: DNA repair protein RadA [Vampirovibrionales bacterium]